MTEFGIQHYPGTELELFREADNWKRYLAAQLAPWIDGDTLEVGAGIGGSTAYLANAGTARSWTCIEPDPALHVRLCGALEGQGGRCRAFLGCLGDLPADVRADTILYIDVIEHIEDDAAELREAARRLRPGGRLIVLVPAHQWLYTPFDRAVGHWRRYDRERLSSCVSGLAPTRMRYLDAVGMLASLSNRLVLNSGQPTATQVRFWDRMLVPVSRYVDPLLGWRVGKSLLGIWTRAD